MGCDGISWWFDGDSVGCNGISGMWRWFNGDSIWKNPADCPCVCFWAFCLTTNLFDDPFKRSPPRLRKVSDLDWWRPRASWKLRCRSWTWGYPHSWRVKTVEHPISMADDWGVPPWQLDTWTPRRWETASPRPGWGRGALPGGEPDFGVQSPGARRKGGQAGMMGHVWRSLESNCGKAMELAGDFCHFLSLFHILSDPFLNSWIWYDLVVGFWGSDHDAAPKTWPHHSSSMIFPLHMATSNISQPILRTPKICNMQYVSLYPHDITLESPVESQLNPGKSHETTQLNPISNPVKMRILIRIPWPMNFGSHEIPPSNHFLNPPWIFRSFRDSHAGSMNKTSREISVPGPFPRWQKAVLEASRRSWPSLRDQVTGVVPSGDCPIAIDG